MLPNHFPDPHLFLPGHGEPQLRWGVIGVGWIAKEFVPAVRDHTTQQIVAVAATSLERASRFAAEHGIGQAFDSVDQLVALPEVDVVYVATPQSAHLEVGLAAIAAGKHVLIEKPLALTAAEATLLVDAARAAGVFLMEAMWSRYLPQASVIRTLIADGALGEIHSVVADHGQAIPDYPNHRLHRPELGGGALLDIGIYPLQFDSMVLGAPRGIVAVGAMTGSGVDAYSSIILSHEGVAQSTITTSILTHTPNTASISGTAGRIELDPFFFTPTTFRLYEAEIFGASMEWSDPTGIASFAALSWEATALATYVGEGRSESPLHTLAETVSILATIDEVRSQLER